MLRSSRRRMPCGPSAVRPAPHEHRRRHRRVGAEVDGRSRCRRGGRVASGPSTRVRRRRLTRVDGPLATRPPRRQRLRPSTSAPTRRWRRRCSCGAGLTAEGPQGIRLRLLRSIALRAVRVLHHTFLVSPRALTRTPSRRRLLCPRRSRVRHRVYARRPRGSRRCPRFLVSRGRRVRPVGVDLGRTALHFARGAQISRIQLQASRSQKRVAAQATSSLLNWIAARLSSQEGQGQRARGAREIVFLFDCGAIFFLVSYGR